MSGQPNRKPQDVDNFRQDYMNQLNLRASIDDVNYQANKVYKATGALPPQSSMPDTRSTSEILADITRLKVELIAEFKPLLNAQSASLLIQRIEQSPLNGDGSLLVFLSQNVKQIVPKLQMRYAKGIKGDEGDIETLKTFIENLYSELKDSTGSIKSFFDRPQSSSSINLGDFVELIRQYDKIRLQMLSKYPSDVRSKAGGTKLRRAFDRILEIFSRLDLLINANQQNPLTKTQISDYIAGLLSVNVPPTSTRPDPLLVKRAQLLDEFITSLPDPSKLRALLSQLDKSLQNSDSQLSYNILINIQSILPNMLNDMTDAQLTDLVDDIQSGTYDVNRASTANQDAMRAQQEGLPQGTPTSSPPSSRPPTPPTRDAPPPPSDPVLKDGILSVLSNGIAYGVRKALQEDIKTGGQLSDVELDAIYSEAVQKSFQHLDSKPEFDGWQNIVGFTPAKYTQVYNLYSRRLTEVDDPEATLDQITLYGKLSDDIKQQLISTGMSGSGIKKRGRVKGSGIATPKKFLVDKVDHTKGIKPDKKYIPFGKYYIHNHKLNDNILSFRQPSGVSVIGQPAHRVSDKLGGVIRSIVGGKVPSFNELNGLTEEEKNYLYKVAKKADIADKISIPTPSKDAMEKDIHDFEVMKGEIMAGNDSKELIKKFKLLLLKLSKNGSLPKVDVQEIMEELLTLGY
jgi:hypothetical protein